MCWLAQGEVFGFALGEFGFMLYRFDSGDKRNDGFDLFGAVIELARRKRISAIRVSFLS